MALNIEQFIGRHFKLKHLIYSNIAANNNINNMPGIDGTPTQSTIIKNLKNLMENVIDIIVDKYPNLTITSGYRCQELNRFIGGSNTSQHIFGQAIDIQVPGISTDVLYNFIYNNPQISSWDQLIWEYPEKGDNSSWVHISYSSLNRKKTTLASNIDGYHKIYNGERYGSSNQYQHNITTAVHPSSAPGLRLI